MHNSHPMPCLDAGSQKASIDPPLSVVMSIYNGAPYLRQAIDSILGQTFRDFELLLINDGSIDDSLSIIESYSDPRIHLISRENRGLVASLNEGIARARGKFIARMDADDLSHPRRLEKQMQLFQERPDAVLCGTTYEVIDKEGKVLRNKIEVPLDDIVIRQVLLAHNVFGHGSVMFVAERVREVGGYQQGEYPAEDYGLWVRLAQKGSLHNLPEVLFSYRITPGSISQHAELLQKQQAALIKARYAHNFRPKCVDQGRVVASLWSQHHSFKKVCGHYKCYFPYLRQAFLRKDR